MLSKTFSLRRKLTSLVYNCNAEFFKLKMTRHNNTILKLKNTCYQKSVAVRRKLKSFECNSVLKFSPIVNERCHPIKSSIFASECNSFRKKRRRSYKFSYLFSNRRRTATLGVTRIGRDWRFAFFRNKSRFKKNHRRSSFCNKIICWKWRSSTIAHDCTRRWSYTIDLYDLFSQNMKSS